MNETKLMIQVSEDAQTELVKAYGQFLLMEPWKVDPHAINSMFYAGILSWGLVSKFTMLHRFDDDERFLAALLAGTTVIGSTLSHAVETQAMREKCIQEIVVPMIRKAMQSVDQLRLLPAAMRSSQRH